MSAIKLMRIYNQLVLGIAFAINILVVKKFIISIKNGRRYCCVCQFQDIFNLWELNKRQVNRLKNYYMQVLTVIFDIKKLIPSEENFWEKDIHFVARNNNVKTFLSEVKDFLFQLKI